MCQGTLKQCGQRQRPASSSLRLFSAAAAENLLIYVYWHFMLFDVTFLFIRRKRRAAELSERENKKQVWDCFLWYFDSWLEFEIFITTTTEKLPSSKEQKTELIWHSLFSTLFAYFSSQQLTMTGEVCIVKNEKGKCFCNKIDNFPQTVGKTRQTELALVCVPQELQASRTNSQHQLQQD